MDQIKVKIKGISPILFHSAKLANPLDPMTAAHKLLTSKRKKTDEDHLAIMKSEWMASMYFSDKVGPYIPGINVEGCLFEAAKMQKLGKAAKRALLVLEDEIKLEYKGPRNLEDLYGNKEYVDVRAVKVNNAKIMRCRPKFNEWSCSFTVQFNPEQLQKGEIVKMLEDAGSLISLGDFRPRFGKFEVEAK